MRRDFQIFTIHNGVRRYQGRTPARHGKEHAITSGKNYAKATEAEGFGVVDSTGRLVAQHYRPFVV